MSPRMSDDIGEDFNGLVALTARTYDTPLDDGSVFSSSNRVRLLLCAYPMRKWATIKQNDNTAILNGMWQDNATHRLRCPLLIASRLTLIGHFHYLQY